MKNNLLTRIIAITISVIILAIIVLILIPIYQHLNSALDDFRITLLNKIESTIGYRIDYESISPSIFSYVELRAVTLQGIDSNTTLQFDRVRLFYNLFDLIRQDFISAPTALKISGGTIRLSSSSATDRKETESSIKSISDLKTILLPIFSDLPNKLSVTINGVLLEYEANSALISGFIEHGTLNLDDKSVSVDLSIAGRYVPPHEISERIEKNIKSLIPSSTDDQPTTIDSYIQLQGRISRQDLSSTFLANVSSLSGSVFDLVPMQFQIDITDNGITIAKILDAQSFNITASIQPDFSGLTISLLAEDWQPISISPITISSLEPKIKRIVTGTSISGSAYIKVTGSAENSILYNTKLYISTPETDLLDKIRLVIDTEGDSRSVYFHELTIAAASIGSATFSGNLNLKNFMPNGDLSLVTDILHSSFELKSDANVLQVDSKYISFNSMQIPQFSLVALFGKEQWTLDILTRIAPLSGHTFYDNTIRIGIVSSPLELSLGLDSMLERIGVSVFLNNVQTGIVIQLLQRFFPPSIYNLNIPNVVRSTRISLDAKMLFNQGQPLISVDNILITSNSEEDFLVSGQLQFQDRNLRVSEISLKSPQGTLSIGGMASFNRNNSVTFGVNARFLDQEILLNGFINEKRVAFSSNLGITGEVDFTNDILVGIRGKDIPIKILNQNSNIGFIFQGRFSDVDTWNIETLEININSLLLPGFGDENARITVEINGIYPNIAINNAIYVDNVSHLQGSGHLVLSIDEELSADLNLSFINQRNPQEGIELSSNFVDEELYAEIIISKLNLSRLGINGLRGGLNANINVNGSVTNPEISISSSITEGYLNADPLRAETVVKYSQKKATVEEFELWLVNTGIQFQEGYLNFENFSGYIEAQLLTPDSIESDSKMGLTTRFQLPGWGENTTIFDTLNADISLRNVPSFLTTSPNWRLKLNPDPEAEKTLILTGGPNDSLFASFNDAGQVEFQLKDPLFLTLSGSGVIEGGGIAIDIPHVIWATPDLSELLDFEVFAITKGQAEGNARITGDINDPNFFGVFEVTGLEASLIYSPEVIGPAHAFIIFENKNMIIPEFSVRAGEARASIQGELVFSRWVPETYDFSFVVAEDPGLSIKYDFETVVVEGFGSGTVFVKGERQQASITGTISAHQTAITLSPSVNLQENGQTDTQSEQDTYVAFTFQSERGVEFFWPTTNVPLFRGLVEPGHKLQLSFDTFDESFSLKGDIPLRGGEIFYFDRNFYVRSGVMLFNETAESFNPRLSLLAEARTSWNGERVTLSLNVDENYLTDLQPRFTSEPTLSVAEINSLIGGGVLPTNTDDPYNLVSQAFLTSTDIVSQFQIMRNIENTIRNGLSLDLFSIRTGLFQNLVKDIIDDQDNSFSFGRYFENTTILIGKYIGDDVFIESMFQITEQTPLYQATNNPIGVDFAWELSVEWQTPFFLLEWNFNPKTLKNLILTDVTDHLLTFSWDFN